MPRDDFVKRPIKWSELGIIDRLHRIKDWFNDFERDDVYDASDD